MARGAVARRRRHAKRRANRVEQQGVSKAPVQDTVVAAGLEESPAAEEVAPEFGAAGIDLSALEALAAVESYAATLVWDAEDGVQDLMCDLAEALNPGDSWRWWVVDVATSLDRAILCDGEQGDYWLAPFTVGADREPTLSPQSEWTAVESAWVESTEKYAARLASRRVALAPMACASCDHAYSDHLGTEGPCTMDGCSCGGYEAAEAEASAEPVALVAGPVWTTAFPSILLDGQPATLDDIGARGGFTLTFDIAETLPPEHGPGARVPETSDGVTIEAPPSSAAVEWTAVFAPEGKLTSDGRAFAPGSITWRELPLTLMAMTETSEGGHIGAEVAGRINEIWRDEASGEIRAKGVFDVGEYGQEIARLVADQTLRGVSVDLAVSNYEVGPRSDWFDEDGRWAPKSEEAKAEADEPTLGEILFGDQEAIAVVLAAEIGMTTVCPFPAFAEAKIVVGDSLVAGANPAIWTVNAQGGWTVVGAPLAASEPPDAESPCLECEEQGEALTASAAGLAPERPPASWFGDPGLDEPTPLTVTDDGHVFGHAALWDSCHIGIPGRCQPPPRSDTGYALFHLGEVVCDDGSRLPVGTVTLDTGHAASGLGAAAATRHYDDTGTAVAYVRSGEDEHGIWVAGAVRSDVSPEAVTTLRGGKLSGDWRKVDGNLELVALLTVNVPGFPVPHPRQLVAGGEVVSLVASGIPIFEADIDPDDRERFAALLAQAEFAALAAEAV